jgi:hypothetical protein
MPGVLRELRPVISHTAGDPAPRLHLAPRYQPQRFLFRRSTESATPSPLVSASDVELRIEEERLARHRDEGMKPAVRPVLVASFPAEDRAGAILGGLAACDGHAELERSDRYRIPGRCGAAR